MPLLHRPTPPLEPVYNQLARDWSSCKELALTFMRGVHLGACHKISELLSSLQGLVGPIYDTSGLWLLLMPLIALLGLLATCGYKFTRKLSKRFF